MGMQLQCTGGEGGGTQWVCVPNAPCCSPCGVQNQKGALTPENLTAAYQKVYGSAPSQDWLNLTCKAYSQSGSNSCSVLSNLAFCKGLKCASSALGISNDLGNQGCFTTGAAKLQQMGATPTGPSYEGVPTSFQLNGKTYQYGSVGNSRCSNSFGWVDTSSLPKCVKFGTAQPEIQKNNLQGPLEALIAAGLVVGGGGLLAGGLLGGAPLAGTAQVFPVADASLISGTPLGAAPAMTDAAVTGGISGGSGISMGYAPGAGGTSLGLDIPASTAAQNLATLSDPATGLLGPQFTGGMDGALGTGVGAGAGATAAYDALGACIAKDVASWGIDPLTGVSTLGTTLSPLSALPTSGLTLSNLLNAGVPLAQAVGKILGGKSPIGSGSGNGSGANSTAAQLASMTPDTSAQIFRVGQTAKDPLAKVVTQPITELTPEYKNIQQTYGCAQTAAKGGLIGSLGHYASGGSTSDKKNLFCFKDSEPKFDEQRPELLMGRVSNSKVEPMVLKQIKTGISGYARGGLPEKYHAATPEGHHPEFITGLTGYYACGGGTGQSDDIPAMLHDGDYVMDAETVSALGDGSSKAGMHVLEGFRSQVPYKNAPGGNPVPAKIADGEYVFPAAFVSALGRGDNKRGSEILDGLREKLRAHKRGAPLDKIPPKAKSPLDYIQKGKK